MDERRLARRWGILAVLSFLAAPIRADEKVDKLIKDLGSSNAAHRETASRELERIGDPAAQALFEASKSGDAEVSLRAQQILKDMQWIPPPLREKIVALRKTREAAAWKKLWDEIMASGDAAQYRLEQELNTPYGDASLKVEGLSRRIKRGAAQSLAVTVKNEGERGFWIQKDKFRMHQLVARKWSASKPEAEAGDPQMAWAIRMQAAMAGGQPAAEEPEAPYVYLAPGETYVHKLNVEGKELDFTGRCRAVVEYNGHEAQENNFMNMRVMIARARGAVPQAAVAAHPLKRDLFGESEWADVLPALDAPPEGLSLKFADDAKGAGKEIPVRLVLQNGSKEAASLPKPEPGRTWGFWYALLNEKGEAAQFGCLDGREEMGSHPLRAILAPSGELAVSGTVVPKVPAGKYKLVCGFSTHVAPEPAANMAGLGIARAVGGNAPPPAEGGDAAEAKDWVGDAVTAPREIEVK